METATVGIGQADRSRTGDWIQTYTGGRFWPLDPRPEEVSILDIAHSLACQSRFAGHCSEPYSIAQHSVMVSWVCGSQDALWGLLHDASEAYLCDLPRPLKQDDQLQPYRHAEAQVQLAVCRRFGLTDAVAAPYGLWTPEKVRNADNIALRTEARDLMGDPQDWCWPEWTQALPGRIEVWDWKRAEGRFLARFTELTGEVV